MAKTLNIGTLKNSGYTDEQIQEWLNQHPDVTPINASQQTPQNTQGLASTDTGGMEKFLPLAGAVAGSFIPIPVVGTIGGAALGAGAGALLKNILDKKPGVDTGEIVKETALGAVGGVVGKGMGYVAGKVLPKIAGKGAENLALRGVRATASQQRAFTKKTGQKLTDFVLNNKLYERGTQQIDELITPLQQQYDDLALASDKVIPRNQLLGYFKNAIKELKSIPTVETNNLAKGLEQEMKLVSKQFGKTNDIPIATVTGIKRNLMSRIPKNQFMGDPLGSSRNRAVEDIYMTAINDTAKGAKEIGISLRDLKAFREIAELQQGLGKGTLPIGLKQIIPVVVGGGAYGASGGDIKTALTAAGFVALANHPKGIELMIKALQKVGTAQLPPIAGQAIGQSAVRLPQIVGGNPPQDSAEGQYQGQGQPYPSTDNYGDNVNETSQGLPPIPQSVSPQGAESQTLPDIGQSATGYTVEQLAKAYRRAIEAGATETAQQIKSLYDMEAAYQKGNKEVTKKYSEGDKKFLLAKNEATKAFGLLERGVNTGKMAAVGSKVGEFFGTQDPATTAFKAQLATARTAARNALLGANMSDRELESYLDAIFSFSNEPKIIRQKLITFINSMQDYESSIAGPTLPDIDQLQFSQ